LDRVLHPGGESHLPQRERPRGAALSFSRHRAQLRRLRPGHAARRRARRAGVAPRARAHAAAPGRGRPAAPHPPVSAYPATATILQGVVERTWRLAVAATYAPGPAFGVAFDAGLHRIANFQHVPGAARTRAAGRVAVSYRFQWQGTLP